ncbi:MAG: putative porin [Methylotenera sp.]|nr:putative porin [Methylotenera sp.]
MMNLIKDEMEINMIRVNQFTDASHQQKRNSSDVLHHARMTYKPIALAIATLCLGTTLTSANAGERESLEQLRSTTVNLVNLLVEEGVLSKGKADELLKQAAQEAEKAKLKDTIAAEATPNEDAVDKAVSEKIVRVQYVPEIVKKEMKEEIKKEVMANLNYKAGERLGLPGWIDRFNFEGDIRLRYQNDRFGDENPNILNYNSANGSDNILNTTDDRNRARVRARLATKVKVNDWLNGEIRIVTGNLNDPLSPNQTQETRSAKYTIGLDRAYLSANITPSLNIVGGRFPNPFFFTDLVWDPSMHFDGVATTFKPQFNKSWSGFATIGAFPLEDVESSDVNRAKSKWLYGSQAGIKWTSVNKSSVKLGVALYEFDNIEGISNNGSFQYPYNATTPAFRQKGNSVFDINNGISGTVLGDGSVIPERFGLMSKFRNINITGEVDIAAFDPVHITLTGDYTRNIGYNRREILSRIGSSTISGVNAFGFDDKQVNAYHVKLAVGNTGTSSPSNSLPTTTKLHDWQSFIAYKYLEADSVVDSYTDSDFLLGGTNAKGWVVGGSYGIGKNTYLSARWFSADEIKPRAALKPLSVDVLMLEMTSNF